MSVGLWICGKTISKMFSLLPALPLMLKWTLWWTPWWNITTEENWFKKTAFQKFPENWCQIKTSNFIRPFMTQDFFTICFCHFSAHVFIKMQLPDFLIAATSSRKKVVQNGQSLRPFRHQETVRKTTHVGESLQSSIDGTSHGPTKVFQRFQRFQETWHFWLVVEPTLLKNMLVKMGSSSPTRDEHKKYLSCHHLALLVGWIRILLNGFFILLSRIIIWLPKPTLMYDTVFGCKAPVFFLAIFGVQLRHKSVWWKYPSWN